MKFLASAVLCAALLAACGGDDDADADASTEPDANSPRGRMSVSWTITQGGDAATCADVGGAFVVLDRVRVGEGAGASDNANCTAGELLTFETAVGTYDVDIDLVGDDLASLLDAKIQVNAVVVNDGDTTELDPVVFEL